MRKVCRSLDLCQEGVWKNSSPSEPPGVLGWQEARTLHGTQLRREACMLLPTVFLV